MVLGLSELMRATVDGPRDHLVPLSTEIDFVRRTSISSARALPIAWTFSWDMDDAALAVPVPTLLLQPLVENAIRHGVGTAVDALPRDDSRMPRQGRLRVRVADDGVGPAGRVRSEPRRRDWLDATPTSRLKQLYGAQASFDVRQRGGGGTVAEVIVPSAPVAVPVRTIA